MRYVVYECERDWVPLSKEIKYIEDFVDLQKLRCGNRAHIELSVEGSPHHLQIAPLILITFVENAFKHGVKNEYKRTFVTIHLAVQDQTLVFCIRNSLPPSDPTHQPGIGLRNVRQRLNLLYGAGHSLAITTPASVYQVQLTLQLASHES
jgi:LytS/YehU family sensor histidine kinase